LILSNKSASFFTIIIFLFIAIFYFLHPLENYNVDALHYNILSFAAQYNGFKSIFFDESTPVHLLWHILNTGILFIFKPANLWHSLLILRNINILIALTNILITFFFFKFYFQNIFTAFYLILLYAFANANLLYFLNVEVYALNCLALTISFWLLFKYLRQPSVFNIFIFSISVFVCILTHLTNILYFISCILFLVFDLRYYKKTSTKNFVIFLITIFFLSIICILLIALLRNTNLANAINYIFNYRSKTNDYVSFDILNNIIDFVKIFPKIFIANYEYAIYIFILLIFILNLKTLINLTFFLMREHLVLIIYVLINFLFFSQWDVQSNIKLKIIFILPSLLLFAKLFDKRNIVKIILFFLLFFFIFVNNYFYTIRIQMDIKNNEGYMKALEIYNQNQNSEVILNNYKFEYVKFYSLTFFNQKIIFTGK